MPQDAIALLDADHQRVELLFRDFQSATDPAQRMDMAQVICMELTVHAMLEEELFYPAYRQASQDDGLVQEAQREHQEAKELIARVPTAADLTAAMLELQRCVEQHVEEERRQMFPKARACGMDLAGLAQQMERRKAEMIASLHQAA